MGRYTGKMIQLSLEPADSSWKELSRYNIQIVCVKNDRELRNLYQSSNAVIYPVEYGIRIGL